jgi:hypothetical protein
LNEVYSEELPKDVLSKKEEEEEEFYLTNLEKPKNDSDPFNNKNVKKCNCLSYILFLFIYF